jgi:hypothetical protein
VSLGLILALGMNGDTNGFFEKFLSDVESSVLNFCRERIAEVETPPQKLVVLACA